MDSIWIATISDFSMEEHTQISLEDAQTKFFFLI
jgi:hypothetical protein